MVKSAIRRSVSFVFLFSFLGAAVAIASSSERHHLRRVVTKTNSLNRAVVARAAAGTLAALPSDGLLVGPPTGARPLSTHNVTLYQSGTLSKAWQDWSWTPHAFAAQGPDGTATAAKVSFKPWGALYLRAFTAVNAWDGSVQLRLNGGLTGGQSLRLALVDGAGAFGTRVALTARLPKGVLPAKRWVTLEVPIHASVSAGASILGVVLQEGGGKTPGDMYVGAITLRVTTLADYPVMSTKVALQVDPSKDRHAISPLIYGLAGDDGNAYMRQVRPALMRWGGNPSSRFNWQIGNAWNASHDYNYSNTNYGRSSGSASDAAISFAAHYGAVEWLTVPTIGWVAKDTTSVSFPGNHGQPTNGQGSSCSNPKVKADPHRTSVAVGPSFMQAWVRHLLSKNEPVSFFSMDNEPELWGVTHYDVHPTCTGYDEIFSKFTTYASAIKSVFPQAQVTGPSSCCWYFYWDSMLGAKDRSRHGALSFLPWFLQSVRQYDAAHRRRTLDVLDVHYYPDGFYNTSISPAISAWRLLETRSLWDPTYIDHSWIAQPVRLIPRLKEMVAQRYPGTRVGIGEWNWGAETQMNGGLAIADVLGIFGQQGLDMAAYWRNPPAGSPGAYAFQLYRNYDGRGQAFGETSVRATSSQRDRVSIFASQRQRDGHVLVMLINKMPTTRANASLDLIGVSGRMATTYRYAQGGSKTITTLRTSRLSAKPTIELPPYSITLLDIA